MAITIKNAPATYTSAHGDIVFVVYEATKATDPTTYPDYHYICDVYIASTQVASLKAYPHPTNKMGIFSVGNIIRSYVAAIFNPTANVLKAQELGLDEFRVAATMKFGEEYEVSGVMTLTSNVTVDSARVYYNHYNGRLLGSTTNLGNVADAPATNRTIGVTTAPPSFGYPVYTGNKNNFVPFFNTTTDAVNVLVESFYKNGTAIASDTFTVTPAAANDLLILNLSPTALNTLTPNLIPLNTTAYYHVSFLSTNRGVDKLMRFDLVCEPKYEVYTLHFLNAYGGFESRDFTKVSRKVIDTERHEFGKLGYTIDASGVVSYKNANNVYNETRSIYATNYKEKLTLNTDALNDAEYRWLADLILSPMVYVEMYDAGQTYHIPCVITNNNYDFRKRVNDSITNLTINIEYGEQFNSQYR